MLFTIFFLQLPGNKYHVNCAASAPETALRFRQDKTNHVLEKTGERDLGQHFACYREKVDATTVATFCSVTLLLVYMNNVGIFPLLWETFSGPAVKDKIIQPSVQSTSTILNDLSRDVVRTGCFVIIETSSKDVWSSIFGMIGSVGRSSRMSGSVAWTLFSRFVGIQPIFRGSITYS